MNKVILVENYAIKKITQPFIKQFLSSVLAGIVIGIAYTAALMIVCYTHSDNEAANAIAK
jgi:formate/nitrite transporter FocA (FNT family)